MGGGNLNTARTEANLNVVVGDDGYLAVYERKYQGLADKVLTFSPRVNQTDYFAVAVRDKEIVENPASFVFESDMCFNTGTKGAKFEIDFCNGDVNNKANIAYRITVGFDNGIFLLDNSNSSSKKMVAAFGEWFNLRAEYYVIKDDNGNDVLRVKVFVGGEHIYTSSTPWGDKGTVGDVKPSIDRVKVYSLLATSDVCYFDEIGVYASDVEYEE